MLASLYLVRSMYACTGISLLVGMVPAPDQDHCPKYQSPIITNQVLSAANPSVPASTCSHACMLFAFQLSRLSAACMRLCNSQRVPRPDEPTVNYTTHASDLSLRPRRCCTNSPRGSLWVATWVATCLTMEHIASGCHIAQYQVLPVAAFLHLASGVLSVVYRHWRR